FSYDGFHERSQCKPDAKGRSFDWRSAIQCAEVTVLPWVCALDGRAQYTRSQRCTGLRAPKPRCRGFKGRLHQSSRCGRCLKKGSDLSFLPATVSADMHRSCRMALPP